MAGRFPRSGPSAGWPPRHRFGIDPPVAGRPPAGNVRVCAGGRAGRAGADRFHPAGRARAAGRRRCWPGRADRHDRRGHPGGARSGAAAHDKVGGRRRAAGRALTPEPARPGWPEALKMAHSALPYERLLDIDARLEHAAARPVIVPDTIVIDHGTMFCQFASGYAGRDPGRRGRHVEDQPLWSMAELQELLDEWLVAFWVNREHDGLRDPEHPGRAFTPNQKYAALVESAGYVPVALGPDDYIELLPASWRAVNAYGIKLSRRSYDSEELNPLRLQPSGVREKKNLWEVRRDPYDISRIHVRGLDGWITVFWKHLDRAPVPFGELAWDHARRSLAGQDATEEQIADAVASLLRRANAGPDDQGKPKMSKRDRRVAARTRSASPRPKPDQPAAGEPAQTDRAAYAPRPGSEAEQDAPLAKVIPLGIFDPFAEADKRW